MSSKDKPRSPILRVPVEERNPLQPGMLGWPGGVLPASPDSKPVAITPTHRYCHPDAVCDRLCTACGEYWCAACVGSGEWPAACPRCKERAVSPVADLAPSVHLNPSHRGF